MSSAFSRKSFAIDIIGVIPEPAAIPAIVFALLFSKTNFPSGMATSKLSPTFKSLIAKFENFPSSIALTTTRNSPLRGEELIV